MTSPEDSSPAPAELTFEEALAELEQIIEDIEAGEIGLEASLAARRRGESLIARCRSILDVAEQELEHVKPDERTADEDEQ
ncbi:MAG: exodeoxyribonuclease VII small subunit [Planctomycetota bacterium]|jgi:exodeoxyribonuclease VII small subunit